MKNKIYKLIAMTCFFAVLNSCSKDDDSDQMINATNNNIEKAADLLSSLQSGNISAAEYISPVTYIQHNLSAENGKNAFLNLIAATSNSGFKVKTYRSFSDGNYVFFHSAFTNLFGGNYISFDIFRFNSEGKIVEHWDNYMLGEPNAVNTANPNTLIDGATAITDLDKTSDNKALIYSWWNNVVLKGKWSLYTQYIDSQYIQHNKDTPNGVALFQNLPDGYVFASSLKYVFGQGNFVLTLAESTPDANGKTYGYYDLWRIENDKIKEHWSTQQLIPTNQSEGLNPLNTAGKW